MVARDGSVAGVTLLEGDSGLGQPLVEALRQQRFEPVRYRGRRVAVDDLHRSALEGLIKAVHRFDPTVGPDLLTYAVPIIRGAVQRCLADQSWTIRPRRPLQERQWTVTIGIEHLQPELRPGSTEDEVCDREECLAEELEDADLPRPSMAG